MIKRFLPSNIIHEESTSRASVVAASYALEGFLAGGVPNLQFYVFVINFNCSTSEFDTDRQIVLLSEALVRELQQQA